MALDLNDKSGNGNTLTNSGCAEVTTGLPFSASKEAVDIESSESDYLYAADSDSLRFSGNFTLECWAKIESFPDGTVIARTLFYKGDTDDQPGWGWYLYYSGGNIYFVLLLDALTAYVYLTYNITSIVSIGTWYHFAVSVDVSQANASKTVFYKDGSQLGNGSVLMESGTVNSTPTATQPLYIGRRPSNQYYYDGMLDEIRIWNDVRTSTEINNNYNIHLSGNESGLVAYYPFESLTNIKKIAGVVRDSTKKVSSVAIASVKKLIGVA